MVDIEHYEIPQAPNNPFPTGRHVARDPRNAGYPYDPQARGIIIRPTRSKTHRVYGGRKFWLHQQIGDCTCCMIVYSTRTGPHYKPGQVMLDDSDAVDLYKITTRIDPFRGSYPPDDTGSDGTSACQAAVQEGWITRYEHVEPTLDGLIHALQERGVGMGINWYPGMFEVDSNGFVFPKPGERPAGGHEIYITAVNLEEQYIEFPNSWGYGWGIRGKGRMSFPVVTRLLNEDGDLVVPIV